MLEICLGLKKLKVEKKMVFYEYIAVFTSYFGIC